MGREEGKGPERGKVRGVRGGVKWIWDKGRRETGRGRREKTEREIVGAREVRGDKEE